MQRCYSEDIRAQPGWDTTHRETLVIYLPVVFSLALTLREMTFVTMSG
jgi:hypothetical protein